MSLKLGPFNWADEVAGLEIDSGLKVIKKLLPEERPAPGGIYFDPKTRLLWRYEAGFYSIESHLWTRFDLDGTYHHENENNGKDCGPVGFCGSDIPKELYLVDAERLNLPDYGALSDELVMDCEEREREIRTEVGEVLTRTWFDEGENFGREIVRKKPCAL